MNFVQNWEEMVENLRYSATEVEMVLVANSLFTLVTFFRCSFDNVNLMLA